MSKVNYKQPPAHALYATASEPFVIVLLHLNQLVFQDVRSSAQVVIKPSWSSKPMSPLLTGRSSSTYLAASRPFSHVLYYFIFLLSALIKGPNLNLTDDYYAGVLRDTVALVWVHCNKTKYHSKASPISFLVSQCTQKLHLGAGDLA